MEKQTQRAGRHCSDLKECVCMCVCVYVLLRGAAVYTLSLHVFGFGMTRVLFLQSARKEKKSAASRK